MRARVAKSGTIHIQHSMFSDEEAPLASPTPPGRATFTITIVQAYDAIRHGIENEIDEADWMVTTSGGYTVKVSECNILYGHYRQVKRAVRIDLDDEAPERKTEEPPFDFPITFTRAHELMLDALRDGRDPMTAKAFDH